MIWFTHSHKDFCCGFSVVSHLGLIAYYFPIFKLENSTQLILSVKLQKNHKKNPYGNE